MRTIVAFLVFMVASVSLVNAESADPRMEKVAVPTGNKIQLFYWPRLGAIDGWHHDRPTSIRARVNMLIPDGFNFSNAESLMYARALFKPQARDIHSLEDFVQTNIEEFRKNKPGFTIEEVAPIPTGVGSEIRSVTYFPKSSGDWERVAYAEDGRYYILFVISSRSEAGYEKALPAYRSMIASYWNQ